MGSFSGVIIGLSFVFGFILFGLVAELYYFLWWKKRVTMSTGEETEEVEEEEIIHNHTPFFLSSIFCWKKPKNFVASNSESTRQLNSTVSMESEQDIELGTSKDSLLKGLVGEESVESELMRVHNLWGPPRFLFTIKEETKEDLEEDAKSKGERSRKGSRTRSLSDVVFAVDNNNNGNTPFLSPLSSPTIKSSPPILDCYSHRGGVNFNPLFESFTENDLNKLRSSPPPKFKFLRDAEEKLIKRLVEEAEKRGIKNGGSVQDSGFKFNQNERNLERGIHQKQATSTIHHHHSQVLPLASSPTKIRPVDWKSSPQ